LFMLSYNRSHCVNLVCIADQAYLVDVGFGGKFCIRNNISVLIYASANGPTRPLPLVHGQTSKWGATDTELRLIYRAPTNPVVQGVWTFQSRISSRHDWTSNYCFGLTEFLPRDFEVMNYATSTRRTSWFTFDIICLKMILDEEKDDIIGALILSGPTLKRRIFGNTETLAECANEDQRVAVLEEYFGISLSRRERDGIRGLVTELKGGSKSGL
jgi:arylamine N-acetyltransferase